MNTQGLFDVHGAHNVAERYIMGELSAEEAETFELHYFECQECAAAVESATIFAANARAIFEQPVGVPSPKKSSFEVWFQGFSWVPAAVAFALALLSVYQNVITIPRLSHARPLPAFQLIGASRGEGAQVKVPTGTVSFALSADIPPDAHFATYICALSESGRTVLQLSVPAPLEGQPITILVPVKDLSSGPHELSSSAANPQPKFPVTLLTSRSSTKPERGAELPTPFSFKGLALAAAGQFTSPFVDTIEVQASSALPEMGGYGSATVVNFRYRDLIRFDLAQTHVIGSSSDCCDGPGHTTLLQASVEGLDVMGMVTADRVVSRLMTNYKDGATEPSVRIIGTRFENLKIAGIPIEVDLAVDLFDRYHKFSDLTKVYQKGDLDEGDKDKSEKARANKEEDHKDLVTLFAGAGGLNRASVVRGLKPASPGLDRRGSHAIYVPGLGTVRLAEIRITPLTRIVSMIQIDFDCPFKGRAVCCMSEDGGRPD